MIVDFIIIIKKIITIRRFGSKAFVSNEKGKKYTGLYRNSNIHERCQETKKVVNNLLNWKFTFKIYITRTPYGISFINN